MTKREQVIVSAYTGYMITNDFDAVQQYIEKKLGRSVFTHELADPKVLKEIQEKVMKDLLDICER